MRFLAIDLGDKRTGLALGDDATGIASPLGLIEVPIDRRGGEDLLDAIVARARQELGPGDAVLIGMPLNMDGTEGPRAKMVRAFAVRLAGRLGRAVLLADERRTSDAADERMARTGLTRGQKKARRDAIAAAEILRGVLEDPSRVLGRVEPGAKPGAEPP